MIRGAIALIGAMIAAGGWAGCGIAMSTPPSVLGLFLSLVIVIGGMMIVAIACEGAKP